MNIGDKIKNAREDMDLSQREIAAMIPMNQSNYSKIERGLQEPNITQLKRIAEILNKSIDELLGIDRCEMNDLNIKNFQKELNALYKKYFQNDKKTGSK